MHLTFLEAKMPLTKRFERTASGLEKQSYPHALRFTSHPQHATTLAAFAAHVQTHAALGHCLLKGNVVKPLISTSRKGSTAPNDVTEWICLDIDGLPAKTTLDQFMAAMGLEHTSYVLQYSCSMGIEDRRLRAHVFIALSSPMSPPDLKRWLMGRNHAVPLLARSLRLTATNTALRYGLDITTCQNDKLLYIAAPILTGIADPYPNERRITTVTRRDATLTIASDQVPSVEANRISTAKAINHLRRKADLPDREFHTEATEHFEILLSPDIAQVTGMRQNGDFIALNLNGGDSWGYYHPAKNDEFIYNFKGEPVYRTKDLLPEYHAALHPAPEVVASPQQAESLVHFAFLERQTSIYYRGTYYPDSEKLDYAAARNETIVRHFLKSKGMPLGDFIPEGALVFEPHNALRYDEQRHRINTFQPSAYMGKASKPPPVPPPTILKFLHHALGSDETITRRFVNWLAFILQRRTRTETAWVLHGTQGTGKGLICDHILKPIFGSTNVEKLTQHKVEEPYNPFMKDSLIVFVDEMEHTALKSSSSVMAKLKSWITDSTVQIREMRTVAYSAPNYTNFIFASNRPDPVKVDREDRRFNVAAYQRDPIRPTSTEVTQIKEELQAFHDYLQRVPIDVAAVRTPARTEARNTMMSLSETAVDSTVGAIKQGNWHFLLEQLPDNDRWQLDNLSKARVDPYLAMLRILIERTDGATGRCNISRDELRVVFEYICGNIPTTPNKFTSLLRHHNLETETIRIGEPTKGVYVTWNDPALVKASLQSKAATPASHPHLKVVK